MAGTLEPFCDKYFANQPDIVAEVKRLDNLACNGQLTYDELIAEMAQFAKIPESEVREFLDKNPPNLELLEYIEQDLKPKYKIGFLSNASDDWLDDLLTPEQQNLFDDVILSFQHGITKPNTAIFELAAERLGVEPTECLFVDDIEAYCEGARAAGMRAIVFRDFESFRQQLQGNLKRVNL